MLSGCSLKKMIETRRGEKFDVTPVLPKATKLITKTLLCATCKELFTAKKYLDLHVSYKHNSTPEPDKSKGKNIENGTDVFVTDRAHEVESPGLQTKIVDLQQKCYC